MPTSPANSNSLSFQEIQYSFARHLRDPRNAPAPADVEDRRMEIYRGLFYRNVESFMANSFPVLREITGTERWHSMVRDYFNNHLAHTPLFPKMPLEFLLYLQNERKDDEDYPFTIELAHYEWLELEVMLDLREIDMHGIDGAGDLLTGFPVLNPVIRAHSYQYPVHRIGPDYLPLSEESGTYLVVYRTRHYEVGFLELNPVSARLIELLQQRTDMTGAELFEVITAELEHPNPQVVIDGGMTILRTMLAKDILLGTRVM